MAASAFIPALAIKYMPALWIAVASIWPTFPDPAVLAGQVEIETCYGLKDKRCWNPRTELKTYREYGFGLGQTTITYKNGKETMNMWREMRNKYKAELKDWTWENRFDPVCQLKFLVLLQKQNWAYFKFAANEKEHTAMMLAAYNGGAGSVLKDRGLCTPKKGCDNTKWFNNIEKYSFKSKKPVKGYSRSFFDINRGYVRSVMFEKKTKYEPYVPDPIEEILKDAKKYDF